MRTRIRLVPRKALWTAFVFVLLGAALALSSLVTQGQSLDYDISGGHFFTQTNGFPEGTNPSGFSVTDEGGVLFWREFQRQGGVAIIGYPMSRRFVWKGFTSQVFQRGIFQWRPETGEAWFINVFDDLHDSGFDAWLTSVRSVPAPVAPDFDAGKSWDQIVRDRQALLAARPAMQRVYLSVPAPLTLLGLPTSQITDMGNHYAIRLQRSVIQEWKVDVPWARAGDVTIANGGAIAVEAGLFPKEILAPEYPPGMATPTPVATPTPTPAPTIYSRFGSIRYEPNTDNIWVEGMIYNQDGTPRNGVKVQVTHQFGWTTTSKPSGPAEQPGRPDGFWAVFLVAGQSNFRDDVWYAQVLEDTTLQPASEVVTFQTDKAVGPTSRQRVFIDWKRNY
ncbi:MAG: hypothetical protein HYX89_02050 [Chloroflexi bacterium]|nr:hypothetical protein [Chloroflexota bacterium]